MTVQDTDLRPVTADDLDLFSHEFATEDGTGPHQWFGFTSDLAVRRGFAENGLLGPQGGVLTVTAKGEAIGRVEWFAASWGRRETSSCWTLAIGLVPSARGRGHGTRAHQLLVDYLFDHTRAHRLQAWTDTANLAEQRALEKAGFRREGVLRGAQWRTGAWHDQVLFAVLRGDGGGK